MWHVCTLFVNTLPRKKLQLNHIMQNHICVITQSVTSCNNDVLIFDTSTLQSHLCIPLPPPQCVKSQDSIPKLLSTIVSQTQGPSPIFSATGHSFRRIVVDQTTGLHCDL